MSRRVRTIALMVALGGVAAVVSVAGIPAARAGGGGCHGAGVEARGTSVELKEACFTPAYLHTQPGDSVTWTNRDDFAHVVAGTDWGHLDEMSQGESVTFRFDRPGVYAYTCYLHPGMNGAVIVGKVKTPTRTVAAAGGAVPSLVANPPTDPPTDPATAPSADEPVATEPLAATARSSTPWQVATFVGFGLFAATAAAWALGAVRMRREPARIQAT